MREDLFETLVAIVIFGPYIVYKLIKGERFHAYDGRMMMIFYGMVIVVLLIYGIKYLLE